MFTILDVYNQDTRVHSVTTFRCVSVFRYPIVVSLSSFLFVMYRYWHLRCYVFVGFDFVLAALQGSGTGSYHRATGHQYLPAGKHSFASRSTSPQQLEASFPKDKFQELARFVDAAFFETNTLSHVVLDTFYVFRDFCKRRPAEAQEAFALVVRYFCDLLLRQLWTSDARQAVYFQFMTDWIEDVKYTSTPPPEVGTLMVLVARYGY